MIDACDQPERRYKRFRRTSKAGQGSGPISPSAPAPRKARPACRPWWAATASEIDRLRAAAPRSRSGKSALQPLVQIRPAAGKADRRTDAAGPRAPHQSERRALGRVSSLAGKADVREELDRLNAHVAAARDPLAAGGASRAKIRFLPGIQPGSQHPCSKSADLAFDQPRHRAGNRRSSSSDEQIENIE